MVKGFLISSPVLGGRNVALKGSEHGISGLIPELTSKKPTAH